MHRPTHHGNPTTTDKHPGAGTRPRGLLVLRGEDFGDPHMARNVSSYVETIKGLLFDHVAKCQGHAVVIFDEVRVWWTCECVLCNLNHLNQSTRQPSSPAHTHIHTTTPFPQPNRNP